MCKKEMNMKFSVIVVMLILMFGCSQKDADIDLVEKFWVAAKNNNVESLRGLISVPEKASMFDKEQGFSMDIETINVGRKLENGDIETTFKRFCYPEISSVTKLILYEGVSKVDVNATFMAQFKDGKNIKPLKKYFIPSMTSKCQGKSLV